MANPKRVVSDSYGIDAEDFGDAVKALRSFDKQSGTEATRAIRNNAKPILAQARALMAASQGTHSPIPSSQSVRLSVVASKGAALRLIPVTGMEWAADLGTKMGGMVPAGRGRRYALRRSRPFSGSGPSFLRWRGFYGDKVTKGNIGFVMGRAVRMGIGKFEKAVLDDLDDLLDEVMTRAGVPRSGA